MLAIRELLKLMDYSRAIQQFTRWTGTKSGVPLQAVQEVGCGIHFPEGWVQASFTENGRARSLRCEWNLQTRHWQVALDGETAGISNDDCRLSRRGRSMVVNILFAKGGQAHNYRFVGKPGL